MSATQFETFSDQYGYNKTAEEGVEIDSNRNLLIDMLHEK